MLIGTPNFPSFADAVDYYSHQGIELRDVRRKIRSQEIYIGKPVTCASIQTLARQYSHWLCGMLALQPQSGLPGRVTAQPALSARPLCHPPFIILYYLSDY